MLSPRGEFNQGVVMGSIHQNRFPANANDINVHRTTYSDGAVIEYDRTNHRLSAILPDGATTELVSNGGISIVGDVTVTGNITATEDIIDKIRSMQADREIYNSHDHPGVSPGLGRTNVPTQRQ